jgi:hypothetical protein
MNVIYHLAYDDDGNLLGDENTIKRNAEAVIDVSMEASLAANIDKTEYTFVSSLEMRSK